MLGNHGRSITKAIFTPLARVLARVGVTPNMVTVAGTVATVAIAVICIPQGWIWQGGIAVAVVMFGDAVDGTLARMTTVGAAAVPYARARAESVGVVAKLGIAERTDRLIIGMGTAILMSLGLPEWVFAAGLACVAFASFVTVCQRIWFTAHNIDEGTP